MLCYLVPGRLIRPMSSRDWNINFFEWDCFDVIVWAVDSTDRARFQEAKEALHSCLSNPDVFGIPVILVATKQVRISLIGVCEQRMLRRACADTQARLSIRSLP